MHELLELHAVQQKRVTLWNWARNEMANVSKRANKLAQFEL